MQTLRIVELFSLKNNSCLSKRGKSAGASSGILENKETIESEFPGLDVLVLLH